MAQNDSVSALSVIASFLMVLLRSRSVDMQRLASHQTITSDETEVASSQFHLKLHRAFDYSQLKLDRTVLGTLLKVKQAKV